MLCERGFLLWEIVGRRAVVDGKKEVGVVGEGDLSCGAFEFERFVVLAHGGVVKSLVAVGKGARNVDGFVGVVDGVEKVEISVFLEVVRRILDYFFSFFLGWQRFAIVFLFPVLVERLPPLVHVATLGTGVLGAVLFFNADVLERVYSLPGRSGSNLGQGKRCFVGSFWQD